MLRGCLCDVIVFAFRFLNREPSPPRNLFTFSSGKDLCHAEGLAQKALNLACTEPVLVVGESSSLDRDDVL
jgi:hypothetical protein